MKLKLAAVILNFFTITYSWSGYIHHYELENLNRSIADVTAFVRRLNRTTYAGNIIYDVHEDFPLDTEVEIRIYGEYTNKYKELPLIIRRSICSMLYMEYQMIKNEIQGVFPDKCPIKKGHYYLKDYVLNLSKMPRNPWSNIRNFKFVIRMFNSRLKINIGTLNVYSRTTLDDEYGK